MYERFSRQPPLTPEECTLALQRFIGETTNANAKLAFLAIGTHSEDSAVDALEQMHENTTALAEYGAWLESQGMAVLIANPQGVQYRVMGFDTEGFGYTAHVLDPTRQDIVEIQVSAATPLAVMRQW